MYATEKDISYEYDNYLIKKYRSNYLEYNQLHSVFFDRNVHTKLMNFLHKKM